MDLFFTLIWRYMADTYLLNQTNLSWEIVFKDKNLINSFAKSHKCKFSSRSKKKPNSDGGYDWNTENFANQSNQECLATYQESQCPYDDWKVWKKKFWINWHSNLKSYKPQVSHSFLLKIYIKFFLFFEKRQDSYKSYSNVSNWTEV